jgi:5-methylcytosine-specific restriction endonuclease McrA
MLKVCVKCGKLNAHFYKGRGECINCTKTANHTYYLKHNKVIKDRAKNWNKNNIDKYCSITRDWRSRNLNRQVASVRQWHVINYFKMQQHKYHVTHKVERGIISATRRARKHGVAENFTKEQRGVVLSVFDNKCFKCGTTQKLTFDHFKPLVGGNPLTPHNAMVLCRPCNSSKGIKNPKLFLGKNYAKAKLLINRAVRKCGELQCP